MCVSIRWVWLRAEWVEAHAALSVPCWLEGRGGQSEGYCHWQ
ncbi:hypothetical protein [Streptomyces sp. HNM0575]|nr:hypothetical protein [Streptomyces sp. HNM0575]